MFRWNARKMCGYASVGCGHRHCRPGAVASQSQIGIIAAELRKPLAPSKPAVFCRFDAEEGQLRSRRSSYQQRSKHFSSPTFTRKNAGYVSQINNDIGDHVKKGQLLAVIDHPELQAQFEKAQAAVTQTKAALDGR